MSNPLKPGESRKQVRAAFALTEPGAGSDATATKATARLEGDYYVINGVKNFCSNGNAADIHGPFLGPEGRIWWTDGRHGHNIKRAGFGLRGVETAPRLAVGLREVAESPSREARRREGRAGRGATKPGKRIVRLEGEISRADFR